MEHILGLVAALLALLICVGLVVFTIKTMAAHPERVVFAIFAIAAVITATAGLLTALPTPFRVAVPAEESIDPGENDQ